MRGCPKDVNLSVETAANVIGMQRPGCCGSEALVQLPDSDSQRETLVRLTLQWVKPQILLGGLSRTSTLTGCFTEFLPARAHASR